MKLDLDGTNVKEIDVTVQEVREYLDGIDGPNLSEDQITFHFDEAQGDVHSGKEPEYYIVFKVTK
jgi:hypothetical protein